MTRHRTLFGLLTATVGLCGWPSAGRAYEEQASLDVAVGAAILADAPTLPPYGVALDLGASRGISDMFVVRGALGYAPFVGDGAVEHSGRVRAELAYLVDVLRWVPFFGLGGVLWLYDDGGVTARPSGHVVLGLDFLFDRRWTLGVDLRTGFFWDGEDFASISEAQLRISRMFDLF